MLKTPRLFAQAQFQQAFAALGLDVQYGQVMLSDRPELAHFQCNGALAAAKAAKTNPRALAEQVVANATHADYTLTIAGPGFINITFTPAALARFTQALATDARFGHAPTTKPMTIVLDYGGATYCKALHAGHIRPAIIGDSLHRLATYCGHQVTGDVHVGDWGWPLGACLLGLRQRQISDNDITEELLAELYPQMSAACKADPTLDAAAGDMTMALQRMDDPAIVKTWEKMCAVSREVVEGGYQRLNVVFDLWRGESTDRARIPGLIERFKANGLAVASQGALVIPMENPDEAPLILVKSNGGYLYGTTDLATLEQRVIEFKPDVIWYVIDHRQSQHCQQFFSAARRGGLLGQTQLEHIPFGTMNGPDGKPFKTREGGSVRLKELIKLLAGKATERLANNTTLTADMVESTAHQLGVATLRFADLSVHHANNYVFDLDKFCSFEGKTGPYLQYTAVRIQSMLGKAQAQGLAPGALVPPTTASEAEVMLVLGRFPDVIERAFAERAPNLIADQAFALAQAYSRFYNDCHILTATDATVQAGWLGLSAAVRRQLVVLLDLLGIEIPVRM